MFWSAFHIFSSKTSKYQMANKNDLAETIAI